MGTKSSKFWNDQYAAVVSWITHKGYDVNCYTDADDRLDFEEKIIHIDSRQHAESRFYTLLHECGHLLISQTASQFQKDHPMYAMSCDFRKSRSKAYQVSLVAEEIEAWKRGRRLAKRLNLHVDDLKLDRLMTDCVMSYIADAAVIAG
jgi:glycosyltransferase involved in cell wall biosynthesis